MCFAARYGRYPTTDCTLCMGKPVMPSVAILNAPVSNRVRPTDETTAATSVTRRCARVFHRFYGLSCHSSSVTTWLRHHPHFNSPGEAVILDRIWVKKETSESPTEPQQHPELTGTFAAPTSTSSSQQQQLHHLGILYMRF